MTIAVVWKEATSLWAAADTRFSAPGVTTKAQRITDHGPKLFPLSVKVWQPGESGFFDSIRLQTTVGFLYAGEVSPALATFALSDAALQNLQISDGSLPSLGEIAEFVRKNAERYMQNWAERWPDRWRFQAAVFGWCPNKQGFQVFLLDPKVEGRVKVECHAAHLAEPIAFGSAVREFRDRLTELRAGGDVFGRTARLPLLAVEQLAMGGVRDDVGRDVQLGYVRPDGFHIFSRVRQKVPGKPEAVMTFLGIDTLELGSVGRCSVGITGVA